MVWCILSSWRVKVTIANQATGILSGELSLFGVDMVYTRIYQIARLIEGNTIFCPLTSAFNTLVTPCSKLPSSANAKSVLLATIAASGSAINPRGMTVPGGH